MRIIITGVAGFIGSNLAANLLKKGLTVCGIDNLSYGNLENIVEFKNHENFEFVYGDIANPLLLKDYKADVVVHLASQKIPRYTNALRTLDENYLMLKNVVNKCLIDKSRIVYASTSDVYGKNPEVPFHENSNLVMGPTTVKRWAYALSKIYGEQYIMANHDEYQLPYTITRFFGSYGPNQNLTWWGGPQSVFIGKALKREPIEVHGDGTQTRTVTFVKDTVDGLSRCVLSENARNEIFNIASNPEEEISIHQLAVLIWKLVNGEESEPLINFIPYASFGKYEDVMRRIPNIDKIKKTLDYNPRYNLREGLVQTIQWQREREGL